MKVAINQAYFFPYIGYFQLIESVDKFIIYENVSFRRRSWITRNRLLNYASGEPFFFRVSVKKKSSYSLMKEVNISDRFPEERRYLLEVLSHNYSKAPYFKEVFGLLSYVLHKNKEKSIHDFNAEIIKELCEFIGITTCIQSDNRHYRYMETELDFIYNSTTKNLNIPLDKKVYRILDMCQFEKADTYINLPGGQELYDTNFFKEKNVALNFLNVPKVKYSQFKNDFVPHLSIIDVLMHNGKTGTKSLIENYDIISSSNTSKSL
jgi:hypothetical protein